jgi:hypothetical protein
VYQPSWPACQHALCGNGLFLLQQRDAIVEVATEEMEQACSEVGLQQQLEELEALVLQRGLLGAEGERCVLEQ